MKIQFLKACCCMMAFGLLATLPAAAQRTPKKRAQQAATGGTTESTQVNNTKAPINYNPNSGIPVRVDSSGSGSEDGGGGKSMRPDRAYGFIADSVNNKRTPLSYEHLRYDDALFAEKVWRELDLHEKMNQTFRYSAQDDNGSQLFVNILMKAVKDGKVIPFEDDRFTTPRKMSDLNDMVQGRSDSNEVHGDLSNPDRVTEIVVTRSSFDPKTVMRVRMMEEWVFDREASRMFCRILGIAPVMTVIDPNTGKERGTKVLFWLYYPDLRATLATYDVYNAKNMGASRMTWEELFEARMFASYITKSTLDNPGNKLIRQMIKDPILALLEGENIKERIFNYEQDLWSY